MPNLAPAAESSLELAGNNLVLVYAVLAIAVIALVFGLFFRRQVLAADPGTENMQTIGAAVEEGAQAYLSRQFRTLRHLRRAGVRPAVPAAGRHLRDQAWSVDLLRRRGDLLGLDRLPRHVAGGQGQRARGLGGA
jgi:hypothetical protein